MLVCPIIISIKTAKYKITTKKDKTVSLRSASHGQLHRPVHGTAETVNNIAILINDSGINFIVNQIKAPEMENKRILLDQRWIIRAFSPAASIQGSAATT
jgi:hypothetical protein